MTGQTRDSDRSDQTNALPEVEGPVEGAGESAAAEPVAAEPVAETGPSMAEIALEDTQPSGSQLGAPTAAGGVEAEATHDPQPQLEGGIDAGSAEPAPAGEGPAAPEVASEATGEVGERPEPTSAWSILGREFLPRLSASNALVGLLCALLGFAVVVQMRQTRDESLSSLRQSDLVRLLDEVTMRSAELEKRADELRASRSELLSGSKDNEAALEVARQRAITQGILSGRLEAEGPGVTIRVRDGSTPVQANTLFTILEELRNAGAEAIEVNGVRVVASSYFVDSAQGVVLDGHTLESPYEWTVIGNPDTLGPALEIPGGAMARVRTADGTGTIENHSKVHIAATREPSGGNFATPVPPEDGS